jgi:thioredoxin reductase (NADPH)
MIGARPNTDWLPAEIMCDDRGFIRTGGGLADAPAWPIERTPFSLETSMPGVFSVGDVRDGSMNRVASAVGEGSIAVRLVHDLFVERSATTASLAAGRGPTP